ncbi:MAG: hypothetical protein K2K98_01040 [Muribaculaceae bacterium]|nr:hypothetical protein [Muribaculaceae bacterium]
MKTKIYFHIYPILPVILISAILTIVGCGSNSSVSNGLDVAESLMESRPDSALAVLDSIDASDLKGKSQKARYALLMSMALDKNYVDTTTFDVLQPAIDYYLENGTPDEKLRTYYYQGRIYQNRNDRDSALHSFMRGIDIADECTDSMAIARTLVAQGILYQSFYDYDGYTDNYLRAANIFRNKNHEAYELDCLFNALNGAVVLNRKEQADSLINCLEDFHLNDRNYIQNLHSLRIAHTLKFGSEQDLKEVIADNKDRLNYDVNGILNLARAYNRLGVSHMALRQLDFLDENSERYDTLKYLGIRFKVLEDMEDYEGALAAYKDFSHRTEVINAGKFEQKSQSLEERHRMELQSERDTERSRKIIWGCIGGLVLSAMVFIILILLMRRNKIKKDLALQKVLTAELENENLKAENELSRQKARTAELENEKLTAEREKLTLENKNLQLQRDNKTLEAENLAHRVEILEAESENLKELLDSQKEMPEEVRKAIQVRIEMLNSYLASQISDHKEFEKTYDAWVADLTADTEEFMNSNRLAFQASHPAFIKYFENHGLTASEINYVCLYAIGLRGKDVGNYMKKRSHVNISSAIRKKLGIDKHETNIGIYVRKLLQKL